MSFQLADTGGLYGASEDPLHELVVQQGKRAIAGADLLVFLVDGREGLVSGDETIAKELRQTGLPVVLAVNKTDDKRGQAGVSDFYQLGHRAGRRDLGRARQRRRRSARRSDVQCFRLWASSRTPRAETIPSSTRRLDASLSFSRDLEPSIVERQAPHDATIAIVGRPNVGKSSLLNRLLNEERVMVSDMPGTTRDAIDATLTWHRRHFRIVDTAGMRRPGRVRGGGMVELVSVAGAKKAIFDADVVALVIDAKEGATDQDAAIGGEADRAGRGVVIIANKWDLVRNTERNFSKTFDDELRRKMRFLDYAPILHISALTGERTTKVLETIDKVADVEAQAGADAGAEQVHRVGHGGQPASQPGPAPRAHHVRGAGRRRAAVVRVLHQRRDDVSLLLRAVSHQPDPRALRFLRARPSASRSGGARRRA